MHVALLQPARLASAEFVLAQVSDFFSENVTELQMVGFNVSNILLAGT
jgi:hypothetical protein